MADKKAKNEAEASSQLLELQGLIKEATRELSNVSREKAAQDLAIETNIKLAQKMEKEVKQLKNEAEKVQKQIDKQNKEIKPVATKIKELRTIQKQLEDNIDELTEQAKIAGEVSATEIEGRLEEARVDLDTVNKSVEKAEKKLARLNQAIFVAQNEKETAESKLNQVVAKAENAEAHAKEAEKEHAARVAEKESVEAELEALKSKADDARKTLLTVEKAKVDAKKEGEQLVDGVQKAQKQLDKIEDDIEKKKKEYDAESIKLVKIAERENTLAQKEAYVKAKFKQAGLQY